MRTMVLANRSATLAAIRIVHGSCGREVHSVIVARRVQVLRSLRASDQIGLGSARSRAFQRVRQVPRLLEARSSLGNQQYRDREMCMRTWVKALTGTLAAAVIAVPWGLVSAQEQETAPPTLQSADAELDPDIYPEEVEVRMQGVVHEAFATAVTTELPEPVVVSQAPPEPIEEVPPEYKPEGRNVVWIPGYWSYDVSLGDFVWVSGMWRDVPPGRSWVPGYWDEVDGGYQWVPGMWVAESQAAAEPEYLPPPPESLEQGPPAEAPGEDHFWIPGTWVYQNRDYVWRPGYWAQHQVGWVWVPARYVPTTYGWVYCDGYWDYHYGYRGQLFAPVYYRSPIYRTAGYRYIPRVVVDTARYLLVHLWVYPRYGYYYFGNYYGAPFANLGYVPWYRYNTFYRHRDPFYDYIGWRYGRNYLSNVQRWHRFYDTNPFYRPRPTLYQQVTFINTVSRTNINISDSIIRHTVLGSPIDQVVRREGLGRYLQDPNRRYVRIDDNDRNRYQQRVRELHNYAERRREAERRIRQEVAQRNPDRIPRSQRRLDEIAESVRRDMRERDRDDGRVSAPGDGRGPGDRGVNGRDRDRPDRGPGDFDRDRGRRDFDRPDGDRGPRGERGPDGDRGPRGDRRPGVDGAEVPMPDTGGQTLPPALDQPRRERDRPGGRVGTGTGRDGSATGRRDFDRSGADRGPGDGAATGRRGTERPTDLPSVRPRGDAGRPGEGVNRGPGSADRRPGQGAEIERRGPGEARGPAERRQPDRNLVPPAESPQRRQQFDQPRRQPQPDAQRRPGASAGQGTRPTVPNVERGPQRPAIDRGQGTRPVQPNQREIRARPSLDAPRQAAPQAQPQRQPVPQTRQAQPQTRPLVPQTRQAVPQTRQAVPQTRQVVPQTRQAVPRPQPQRVVPQLDTRRSGSFDRGPAPAADRPAPSVQPRVAPRATAPSVERFRGSSQPQRPAINRGGGAGGPPAARSAAPRGGGREFNRGGGGGGERRGRGRD